MINPLTTPRSPSRFTRLLAAGGLGLLLAVGASKTVHAADGEGPTPLPDPKDAAAWPGKGPIRTFGWMTDNRKHFWKSREKDQGAVVFIGDSLTAGWKTLAADFPGLKVANRGIGGDVSRGVLFRFKEDVLELKPRAVVILIGANDLSAHANPAGIEENIKEIIDQARTYDAKLPLVICTLTPRDSETAPLKPGALDDINTRIRALEGTDPHLAVFDFNAVTSNPDGGPILEMFAKDRLHLAAPAYQKWSEEIKPVLAKLGVE